MLYAIVAHDQNRLIGGGNDLLWHLPNDLKYFKERTRGFPIIMGRKTFDSLGRPLPGRRNMVVTRQADWTAEGVEVFGSLEDALAALNGADAFIVGGGEIYRVALPSVDLLYVTEVHAAIDGGDTWFPNYSEGFTETAREDHPADERHAYAYSFVTLIRNQ
ncbi:MAG: dihydrofolate reductase [Cryomorphaceae bacterium]|jgi:dihydrofolate reductase|nr:dihydrofolate reductase [Cryomorphaceae bacterium]